MIMKHETFKSQLKKHLITERDTCLYFLKKFLKMEAVWHSAGIFQIDAYVTKAYNNIFFKVPKLF